MLSLLLTTVFPLNSKELRTLELAAEVLRTLNETRFQPHFYLQYAEENDYQSSVLVHIVECMRCRRQKILNAANTKPLVRPLRWFHLQIVAIQLQKQMETFFEELYTITGDHDLYVAISEARFITPQYLGRISRARANFLRENHVAHKPH